MTITARPFVFIGPPRHYYVVLDFKCLYNINRTLRNYHIHLKTFRFRIAYLPVPSMFSYTFPVKLDKDACKLQQYIKQ